MEHLIRAIRGVEFQSSHPTDVFRKGLWLRKGIWRFAQRTYL